MVGYRDFCWGDCLQVTIMTSDQEAMIWWLVFTIPFTAYTRNVQEITLELGRSLSNTGSQTGIQDAITPRWQTRNNILMFIVWALLPLVFVFTDPWFNGIIVAVATIGGGILLSRLSLLLPSVRSRHIAEIRSSCEQRLEEFRAEDDLARAAAMEHVLELFDRRDQ